MGLFSTLLTQAKTTGSDATMTTATTSHSSLSLPTVIQLYSQAPVEFVMEGAPPLPPTTTTTTGTPSMTSTPGTLSYQAVEVAAVLQEAYLPESVGLRSKKVVHPIPDLGVWDCHVTPSNKALVDALLQVPGDCNDDATRLSHAFSITVDLSADLSQVEPTITRCQEALVRYLITRRTASTSRSDSTTATTSNMPMETATTTLYQLRSVQFGLAVVEGDASKNASSSSTTTTTTALPSETDRSITVALLITVKLPLREYDENYKDKQARALMMYHLRRFAALLNATLVFYKEAEDNENIFPRVENDKNDANSNDHNDNDDTNNVGGGNLADSQPALTLNQLALVWKEFALGHAVVWKDEFLPELNISLPEGSPHSLVYGPDNHNLELIESVLLRNASYPGHWDAAKESIWTILPPPSQSDKNNSINSKNTTDLTIIKGKMAAGDEHWLAELRDSVAAMNEPLKTPSKSAAGDAAAKASATPQPSDGDVSSFFENLLK